MVLSSSHCHCCSIQLLCCPIPALTVAAASSSELYQRRRGPSREVCVVNPNQFGWCKTLAGGPATPLLSITVRCIVSRWNNCSAMARANQPWVGNWYPAIAILLPNHPPYRAIRVNVVWTEQKAKNMLNFVITWWFLQLFVIKAQVWCDLAMQEGA